MRDGERVRDRESGSGSERREWGERVGKRVKVGEWE